MKLKSKVTIAVLAAVLFGATFPGFAQTGDLKIGFVNLQELMVKAPQAAAAIKKAEKEFTARHEELRAIGTEIQALRERLVKERITMSDDARKKLEDELLRKERDFRWKQTILDEDAKLRENQISTEIRGLVFKAILEIAKQDKYDLVLTDGVLYKSPRVDLTAKVLAELERNAK
ncbi:MAG TPA: OmpH family outer membrane protein [Gammaproteobacteria bacterium]|jgi:outer membrane protein